MYITNHFWIQVIDSKHWTNYPCYLPLPRPVVRLRTPWTVGTCWTRGSNLANTDRVGGWSNDSGMGKVAYFIFWTMHIQLFLIPCSRFPFARHRIRMLAAWHDVDIFDHKRHRAHFKETTRATTWPRLLSQIFGRPWKRSKSYLFPWRSIWVEPDLVGRQQFYTNFPKAGWEIPLQGSNEIPHRHRQTGQLRLASKFGNSDPNGDNSRSGFGAWKDRHVSW